MRRCSLVRERAVHAVKKKGERSEWPPGGVVVPLARTN